MAGVAMAAAREKRAAATPERAGNKPGGAQNAAPAGKSVPNATRRYRNGMSETVRNGRYEMRDARGRSIINRPATLEDYRRVSTGS